MAGNGNGRVKPKIAFFDFSSCEGCQLTVVDSLQTHLDLLDAVEIVNFREAISDRGQDYAIAFVEGSCTRESDEARLHQIREQADLVVALGACAHLGGVNAIKNIFPLAEVRDYVYGDKSAWYDTYATRPISEVIEVDAVLPGCPIDREEFISFVKQMLQGRMPQLTENPVCVECRLKENTCVWTLGQVCLGPIARAGCGAICPTNGLGCEGCRGLTSEPNFEALFELMDEAGISQAEVEARTTLFLSHQMEQRAGLLEQQERA
jgi:coenzyme F420-reducing hydrogenase gamma subunit